MYKLTAYLLVILSISLQNKDKLFCDIFTFFVFVAPNLVYFHNLHINKWGIVNGKLSYKASK